MPARSVHPAADRQADRDKAIGLLGEIRQARADIRDALKALPAPASRTAAQKRDALILRTVALLVQWAIIGAGTATASDRDTTES